MTTAAAPASARPGRRLRRIVVRAIVILALIPIVLVPIYWVVPPISTLMIFTRLFSGPIERTWVSFGDMAPTVVTSVMVSEDARFCSHSGVDWQELSTVLDRTEDRPRGASTITMQTMKNLFLWNSRSYVRKALEIPLALYANIVWSKRRTIEIYLNIVQWGPNLFGVEAAAQHYFNRPASKLTPAQAALLAVTLPDPIDRNPAKPTRYMQVRAHIVAARARAAGPYITCLYPQ